MSTRQIGTYLFRFLCGFLFVPGVILFGWTFTEFLTLGVKSFGGFFFLFLASCLIGIIYASWRGND